MKDLLDQVSSREAVVAELAPARVEVLADPLEVFATVEREGRWLSGELGRLRVERIEPLGEGAPEYLVRIELHARDLIAEVLGVPSSERFLVDEGLAPYRVRTYRIREKNPFPVAWRRLLKNLREAVERVPSYGGEEAAERFERSLHTVELVLSGPKKVAQFVLPAAQVHDALSRYLGLA
jgi:hypothetical protein